VKISVVVTVYKRYNFLDFALNSVKKNIKNLNNSDEIETIIISDDPSRLSDLDTSIIIKCDSPSWGECLARGVDEAEGDVITFLDDDDVYAESRIKRLLEIFSRNKNLMYYHNRQIYMDMNGRKISKYNKNVLIYEIFQPRVQKTISAPEEFVALWLRYPAMHHNSSSIAVRKELLVRNLDAISKTATALDWAITLLAVNRTSYIDSSRLTYYRIGSGKTSPRAGEGEVDRLINVYERELKSKKTFVESVDLDYVQQYYAALDIKIHETYLNLLKLEGPKHTFSLKEILEITLKRHPLLAPMEAVMFSLTKNPSLFKTYGRLLRVALQGLFL